MAEPYLETMDLYHPKFFTGMLLVKPHPPTQPFLLKNDISDLIKMLMSFGKTAYMVCVSLLLTQSTKQELN